MRKTEEDVRKAEAVKEVEFAQLDKYENMIKFRDFVNAECEKMGHKEDAQMCREFYSVIQRECDIIQKRWAKDEVEEEEEEDQDKDKVEEDDVEEEEEEVEDQDDN
jgi:hypothetical protein